MGHIGRQNQMSETGQEEGSETTISLHQSQDAWSAKPKWKKVENKNKKLNKGHSQDGIEKRNISNLKPVFNQVWDLISQTYVALKIQVKN